MELVATIMLFILGLALGDSCSRDDWVIDHIKKPYCEEKRVGHEKIKRCYKAVQVNAPSIDLKSVERKE